ncbi:MAG: transposase [Okeania sp. SIO2F4]|nr:transposase [Okeania sp. SIO2F4]
MPLNVRLYECENCGFKADRDFNAAVNLENYARQYVEFPPISSLLSKISCRLRSVVFWETGS